MTQSTLTPTPAYQIQGTGPYAITHGYSDKTDIKAAVIMNDLRTDLVPDTDFFVAPDSDASGGNLTLSQNAANTYGGGTLYISRNTATDQGWQGIHGAREAGLEAQLDKLAQGIQDVQRDLQRALRLDYALQALALKPNSLLAVDAQKQIYSEDPNILAQLTPDFAQTQAYIDGLIDTRVPIEGPYRNMMEPTTTGGTAPHFTLASPVPVTSLQVGQRWLVAFHDALGGPDHPDISIDGLPAVKLMRMRSWGKVRPTNGAIQGSQYTEIFFDGTDMILTNPCGDTNSPGPLKLIHDPAMAINSTAWPPSQASVKAVTLAGKVPVDMPRSVNTYYTNVTSGPLLVEVLMGPVNQGSQLEITPDGTTPKIADYKDPIVGAAMLRSWVPPGWQYRVLGGQVFQWREWQ